MVEEDGRPSHHLGDGRFRNPPGSPPRGGDRRAWWGFLYRRLLQPEPRIELPPGHVLTAEQALAALSAAGSADSLTWLGHSCFLIRIGGRTILTDPYLSPHASPLPPLGPKRFAPAPLRVEALPPVDLVLLSHNHYDHLDLPTLTRLARRDRPLLVTALGVGRYLPAGQLREVIELDWHGTCRPLDLAVTALPAIHFAKRGFRDRNRSLWCGFRLEGPGRSLYFAGDTAFGPALEAIGRRHPPVDLALVPIGAYEPRALMQGSHCTPEEAVEIGRIAGAGTLCAMHWGTIRLTDEPPFAPPGRFRAAAGAAGYPAERTWVMAIGETRLL